MLNIYHFLGFSLDIEDLAIVNMILMFTTLIYVNMNYIQLMEKKQ